MYIYYFLLYYTFIMEPYIRIRTVKFKGEEIIIKYVDIMDMIIVVSNLERGIHKQSPLPTLENEKYMQELYACVIDDELNNIN